MRASALILCGLLLASSPCFAVPVASRQPTGDPWDVGARTPKAPCQNIRSQLAFAVPSGERVTAIGMLKASSVRALSDKQAAALLQQRGTDTLFTSLLVAQVTKLQAQRAAVVTGHIGSWSDADTVTTSDLAELMGPHYPPYRPYLVRALAGAATLPENFVIQLCGDTLMVENLSDGKAASRLPVVVFLQASPVIAIPSWYR